MGSIGPPPTKILIIGGCYGGLSVALNLHDLCNGKQARATLWRPEEPHENWHKIPVEIKIVDERDGYYHLIGSPLVLASEQYADKSWVKYSDIPALKVPGINFMQGRATKVDCERKIAIITDTLSGKAIEEKYDYLVVSTGLRRQWPTVPQSLKKKEYLAETKAHIQAVRNARDGVVVIGGGAVGIEMAAEIKLSHPSLPITLIHSHPLLLSSEPLPDEFKSRTASILQQQNINLILGKRVNTVTPINKEHESPLFNLAFEGGKEMLAGHVISAISNGIPSTSFLPPSCLDPKCYVKVTPTLNFNSSPNHFAIGDIAAWSGIKRCGGAMAMGHTTAINIYQQLLSSNFGVKPKFIEYPKVKPMIVLAVGKAAVVYSEEEGISWGEEKMDMFFGEDLGFSICWKYLRLGDSGDAVEK